MVPWLDTLALAGSPVQWAAVVLLGVLIFAPQLLPRLARWAGRLAAGGSPRRRVGGGGGGGGAHASVAEQEVLPPERPGPTFRASDPTPLAEGPPSRPSARPRRAAPWWCVPAVVCAAIGVILWLLLRQA